LWNWFESRPAHFFRRGCKTYRETAVIFRLGHASGVSLTTIDALIAAIAQEHIEMPMSTIAGTISFLI
jgi:hypothetical protein